ncbi:CPBP family intramembrane glutamic endopeptidase [Paenibacillus sp. CMAA1364]
MNPLGQPLKLKVNYKVLSILASIGLLLFIMVQVLPSIALETAKQQSSDLIHKNEARAAATQFAESSLQLDVLSSEDSLVTYHSYSELYGYLAKEKLVQQYQDNYASKYPYDVYRVRVETADSNTYYNIDLHMNTAEVVAFAKEQLLVTSTVTSIQSKVKEDMATQWLVQLGYDPSDFQLVTNDESSLTYANANVMIGKAPFQIKFNFDSGQLASFQPSFAVPEEHITYVNKEHTKALWMTIVGYGLLTLALGVLAIVYSALTRKHTSFVRGIFLSSFYFVVSILSTLNMLPALEAQGITGIALIFGLLFQGALTLVMSALLYFSLVGGDGLWRKEALMNPWPRFKEAGYGHYVLHSMFVGYLWAFILLGLQSIIFFTLNLTLHSWSTTDASQSPLNMFYPWMFPLLAWVAGISEEAVYRLFGIKMMKKLVKNTFLACLIPSIIWALGHTLYPIYPVISRPIELIIIGLLFSFIFLRYGYIAVMFSHVVFNSILMGFSLFMLGDTINIVAGVVSMIMPFVVAYVIYMTRSILPKRRTSAI